MALEIVWTKRADRKFDKIIEYLSLEWNEQVAGTFVKKFTISSMSFKNYQGLGQLKIRKKESGVLRLQNKLMCFIWCAMARSFYLIF